MNVITAVDMVGGPSSMVGGRILRDRCLGSNAHPKGDCKIRDLGLVPHRILAVLRMMIITVVKAQITFFHFG